MQTDKIPRYNISKAELYRAGEILRDEYAILNSRRVQVLLVKNEKEHAWAINSRNID